MNFENRNIEVSSLPEIDSFEKSKIESALILSFDKIARVVNNELLLHAHFKQHKNEGPKVKHSVHLKLTFPGKTTVASESGWELLKILQIALNNLERETVESIKKR